MLQLIEEYGNIVKCDVSEVATENRTMLMTRAVYHALKEKKLEKKVAHRNLVVFYGNTYTLVKKGERYYTNKLVLDKTEILYRNVVTGINKFVEAVAFPVYFHELPKEQLQNLDCSSIRDKWYKRGELGVYSMESEITFNDYSELFEKAVNVLTAKFGEEYDYELCDGKVEIIENDYVIESIDVEHAACGVLCEIRDGSTVLCDTPHIKLYIFDEEINIEFNLFGEQRCMDFSGIKKYIEVVDGQAIIDISMFI